MGRKEAMLTRWDPFADIDRLTSRLFGERERRGLLGMGTSIEPAVDVFETDGAIELRAEVPGLTAEDVHIDLNDNVLTLSGERRLQNDETREGYRRIERSYGRFERSFSLPRHVDPENIEASLSNGILVVKLPKREEEAKRTIGIKSEGEGEKKLGARTVKGEKSAPNVTTAPGAKA
jgi:HSP20 family protein